MPPIILIFISFCHLVIGFGIYQANPKKNLNKAFLLFCLCLFGWIFLNGVSLLFTAPFNSFITRTATIFGILLCVVFVYFTQNFPNSSHSLSKKFLYINGLIFTFLLMFVYTDLYISHTRVINCIPHFKVEIMYSLAMVYAYFMLSIGLLILIRKFFKVQKEEKAQIFLLTFGVLSSALMAMTFTWFLPMIGNYQYNHLGMAGTLFLIICCSIAITKYRLMEITKTLKTIIIFALFFILFIGLLSLALHQKINTLILICTALFHLTIGSLILKSNRKEPINIVFFLICLILFLWVFIYSFIYLTTNNLQALFIVRTMIVPSLFLPLIAFYFAKNFPNENYHISKLQLIFHTAIILITLSFVYTNYFISSINVIENKFIFNFNFMYIFFELYLAIMLLYASGILLLKGLILKGEPRLQVILLGIGAFSSLIFVFLFSTLLPILGFSQYNFFSPVGTIFLVSFWAIAIIKYRLMEITVIIKKSIAASIIAFLVIASISSTYYFTHDKTILSLFALLGLSLFWSFYALPLQRLLITTAKRTFTKGYYNSNQLLVKITEEISNLAKREEIFKTIEKNLYVEMELEKSALIIADRGQYNKLTQYWFLENEIKLNTNKKEITSRTIETEKIHLNAPIVEFFRKKTDYVLIHDLKEEINDLFLTHDFKKKSVILPFHSPEMLEGLIIIGERSNQVSFKKEDLDFFKMLINNTNALLYRLTPYELIEKQFNENQKKLFDAEIQLIRSKKIEAIVHATRQCHHEVKTPLSIIKMTINELPNTPELMKPKQEILEEIDRAVEITNETLLLTDGAASKQIFRLTDINKAIIRATKLIPKIQSFEINLDLTSLPKIKAIQEDIEILFTNLINNSLEAMKNEKGIIGISSELQENEIIIKFSDTGKGIPKDLITRIWEPYVSGMPDAGNSTGGRGWGLTIANRIVQDHHGTINVESEVNKGTTFTIRLPII
ncbi:MAG: ATP-binding protein [Candidatus Margulisiibacteriota bacterium]|jgi:signal transduction histidine kinase